MNSFMNEFAIGRSYRSGVASQIQFSGLIAAVVVAGLSLAGCGKRHNTDASAQDPASRSQASANSGRKSEAQLETLFKSAGAASLSIGDQEGFARIKPIGNVTLTPQPEMLKIEASDRDPAVRLPGFAGGHAIVELKMESPADTTVQLFYLLPGQKSYSQTHSQELHVKAGKNVVYFELSDPSWIGALRLDPGMVPGEYLLESIKAKAFPVDGIH